MRPCFEHTRRIHTFTTSLNTRRISQELSALKFGDFTLTTPYEKDLLGDGAKTCTPIRLSISQQTRMQRNSLIAQVSLPHLQAVALHGVAVKPSPVRRPPAPRGTRLPKPPRYFLLCRPQYLSPTAKAVGRYNPSRKLLAGCPSHLPQKPKTCSRAKRVESMLIAGHCHTCIWRCSGW